MAEERVSEGTTCKVTLNSVLRNKNLSYGARGILAYMLTFPEEWVFDNLPKFFTEKDKRHKVNCYMEELLELGYIKVVKWKCKNSKYIKVAYKLCVFIEEDLKGMRNEAEEKSKLHEVLELKNKLVGVENQNSLYFIEKLSANNQTSNVKKQTSDVENQNLEYIQEKSSVKKQTSDAKKQTSNDENQRYDVNFQHYSNSNSNSNSYVNSYCYSNMDNFKKLVHVKLKDEEYNDLVSRYGEELVNFKINAMENYVAKTKKVYFSHYKILGIWLHKEVEKRNKVIDNKNVEVYEEEYIDKYEGNRRRLYFE